MDFHTPAPILITCARLQAEALAADLEALGFEATKIHRASVETEGTLADCMMLNLWLRSAFAVLYHVGSFECNGPDELYRGVYSLPWEEMIPAKGYLSVTSRVDHPSINNSMFPSLKTKDAIVDRIADRRGHRPDSGKERRGAVVTVYWRNQTAHVYLNTSGENLAMRGYRKIPGKAPLSESLAASILHAVGYDGSMPLVVPMCGTGTLAIEAALIARHRAPGLLRNNFGFQHLTGCDAQEWDDLRFSAKKQTKKKAPAPIIASDIDPAMVNGARKNALTAGAETQIQFEVTDFAKTALPDEPGILIVNPEYGQRLGDEKALEPLYERLGDFFKQRCSGWRCAVFTGNLDLAKKIGLRTAQRIPMMNADIDCRLLIYDIWDGSLEDQPAAISAD